MTMLSRRRFLGMAGAAAVSGSAAWAALVREHVESRVASPTSTAVPVDADGRVLVVVQLGGGNDGLNTLVPLDGRYHDLRPSLGIADGDLVALAGETRFGLHPSLAPLGDAWDADRLAFVDSIGFEGYSRSHFQASATWWTATPDLTASTGWLGRWLDEQPDAADNPLLAISVGGGGAPALRAERARSTVISDLDAFRLLAPRGVDADALTRAFLATAHPIDGEPVMGAAQAAVTSAVDAVGMLSSAFAPRAATGEGDTDDTGDTITAGLDVAANLIGLDLGTRIVLVGASGFDTHANQAGDHATLLADVAGGLSEFATALDARGLSDRVLVITTSEFGRRAAQNGSAGTDHGAAGAQLLLGGGGALAAQTVVGDADLSDLVEGDLRPTIDVRSLYAVALDWLGGPTDDVLGRSYDRFGLLSA
jgi:uncharacterized protein (DUF1501 family)